MQATKLHEHHQITKSATVADLPEPLQKPLAPAAGFVSAVEPKRWRGRSMAPLDRIRWARDMPVISTAERVILFVLASHSDPGGTCCKFLPHLTVIPTTLDGDSYDT
ncbi:MAG: hypothetical protein OXC11_09325 [Rhodospirillales bacterium]|nr:hypothetical protein [Rhodospirillales bacterium]